MKFDTNKIFSVTERNKNLSMVDSDTISVNELTDDEKIDVVAKRILNKHKTAFIELAK